MKHTALMGSSLTGASETTRSSFAVNPSTLKCYACGSGTLSFSFGPYGQTLETCSTPSCVNAEPHRPIPAPDVDPPKQSGGRQGKMAPRVRR